MKVFLSWSGEVSRQVAQALYDWLPNVMQSLAPWVSTHDIRAGVSWNADLGRQLSQSGFGVLCLTSDNLLSPWLLFEAGAISKGLGETARIVPYRFGVDVSAVQQPLSQFQGVDADQAGTFALLKSLNEKTDGSLETSRLERSFEHWWPSLREQLASISKVGQAKLRTELELLEEMREDLRLVSRFASESDRRSQAILATTVGAADDRLVTELGADEIFTGAVVRWSESAQNAEVVLRRFNLSTILRLVRAGYVVAPDLRDFITELQISGDLGSTDPRDLGWIQSKVAGLGIRATRIC